MGMIDKDMHASHQQNYVISQVDDWNEKIYNSWFFDYNKYPNWFFWNVWFENWKKVLKTNNKKEILINWEYKIGGKWSNNYENDIEWEYKGFWIGEVINHFFKDN